MNILIVSGSQRESSNSAALSSYLKTNCIDANTAVQSEILELAQYPYLLNHYGCADFISEELAQQKEQVLSKLYACDAIIFVTPEWGGMIPPALVNLLLLTANGSAGGFPLAHKPAFAIGVSASGGGSNPISLLKAYAAKNSHLVWLPLHAIVQNVEEFLVQDWRPSHGNRYEQVQSRLAVGIESLGIYAKQLSVVRKELTALSEVHPFGQ